MSPEYKNWFEVPRDLRNEVKRKLQDGNQNWENELQRLLNGRGFVFLRDGGNVNKVCKVEGVSQGVIADARKKESAWVLVYGFGNKRSKEKERVWDDVETEEARLSRGHFGSPYRGNHRSHNKGSGWKSWKRR